MVAYIFSRWLTFDDYIEFGQVEYFCAENTFMTGHKNKSEDQYDY